MAQSTGLCYCKIAESFGQLIVMDMPKIFTNSISANLVHLLIYWVLFQELADANKQRKELTLVEKVYPFDIFSTARIQGCRFRF